MNFFRWWFRMDAYSLDQITSRLDRLITIGEAIMAHLDEIRVEMERNRSVMGSAVVILDGLAAKLDEFANQPEEIRAIAAELRSDVDGFAADLQRHTEADPDEPTDPVDPEEPQP